MGGKTKKEIDVYVNTTKNDVRNNKYKMTDVGVPKPWTNRQYRGKTVYHIEAAKWSNKYLNTKFDVGSRFYVVYVKRVGDLPKPKNGAIAFDEKTKMPKRLVIDWKKQMPVLIDNKVDKIYEMLGWENTNLTYRFVLWNLREKVLVITCCKQVASEIATPRFVVFAMT